MLTTNVLLWFRRKNVTPKKIGGYATTGGDDMLAATYLSEKCSRGCGLKRFFSFY